MRFVKEGVRVGASRHGLGVFSLRRFHYLEQIGPIRGQVIDDPAYESDYCMELGTSLALEPAAPFRYLNHSCDPNCAIVEIEKVEGDPRTGELWIEVLREVAPGEPMTIDYGWPARVAIRCDCGSPSCRGWIVATEQQGSMADAQRPTDA